MNHIPNFAQYLQQALSPGKSNHNSNFSKDTNQSNQASQAIKHFQAENPVSFQSPIIETGRIHFSYHLLWPSQTPSIQIPRKKWRQSYSRTLFARAEKKNHSYGCGLL
jgi:hypothetical protein